MKSFFCILAILSTLNLPGQIDPGVEFDLNSYINDRLDAGETVVKVPPGRYRVPYSGNNHLLFAGRNDVTIIADSVEMVCTNTVPAIRIESCNNFKLQGISVDYDPLPFTQGSVVALSAGKSEMTVDLLDGYGSNVRDSKVEIYDPVTGELAARTYYGATFSNVVDRSLTISGATFNAEPGDIVVLDHGGSNYIPHAVRPAGCTNLVLENVTVYAGTSFAFFETSCSGSQYLNCKVARRPPENDIIERSVKRMRSNNADAFHSKFASIGPSYFGCEARYMGDDGFNINGNYHIVLDVDGTGTRLSVAGKGGDIPELYVEEAVELVRFSGERIPDAKIVNIEQGPALTSAEKSFLNSLTFYGAADETVNAPNVYYVTIDRSVDLDLGSLIASSERVGNGFQIRNCIVEGNRSRGILAKGSNGIISGNQLINNWGRGILVDPSYRWLEAGSANNITISDNTITGCHGTAISVEAEGGNGEYAPAGAHNNIQIIRNTISGSPNPGILVSSTKKLKLMDNTILNEDSNPKVSLINVEEDDTAGINVTGVSVTPTHVFIEELGQTAQLSATVKPAGAENKAVTWSSGNPEVATVDSNGLVTAVVDGTAKINATTDEGNITAFCEVEINRGTIATNIALHKPVTVSAEQDPAPNLVDGDVSSRWSAQYFPQSAEIDLGADHHIIRFELSPYQNRDYHYTIELKANGGSSYTTVVDHSNNTSGASVIVDTVAATGRYVKINITGANSYTGSWTALNELKVFGVLDGKYVEVEGISISPDTISMEAGQSLLVNATLSPVYATNQSIKWTSGNTSVATISADGFLTAIGGGTTTITARTYEGGSTAQSTVNVSSLQITDISVNPSFLFLKPGQSEILTAILSPFNAPDNIVSWISDNPSVVDVDANGVATAVAEGSTFIIVSTNDGSLTDTCRVEVSSASNIAKGISPVFSSVQSSNDKLTDGLTDDDNRWSASGFPQWAKLDLGADYNIKKFEVYPYEQRAYQYIIEVSSDGSTYTTEVDRSSNTTGESVFVDFADVTGRYVKITVSGASGYTGSWTAINELMVYGSLVGGGDNVGVTGISVSPTTASLSPAQTAQLTAAIVPDSATNKSITWSSDNTEVASVDENGLVTALAAGTATITVTTSDGNYTATCSVTVHSNVGEVNYMGNRFINVFPNPATDILHIVIDKDHNHPVARIVDLTGTELFRAKLNDLNNTIDLSAIKEGVYFLYLSERERVIGISKIIVGN